MTFTISFTTRKLSKYPREAIERTLHFYPDASFWCIAHKALYIYYGETDIIIIPFKDIESIEVNKKVK